ncbi:MULTISPECIES: GNAT family N-acetyltransferase [Actinomadura]|uniref:GNAT family N-acetyltransferase n=1 Tax=Actinomadura yumaensis TaxID=111807 RepID=A0ABW2CEP8_9ACTN|nr:GNAT family N-acetyltransferase [Actinomadura sp. J1-007]MWK34685.1 GNAT family N-acetyltransferase [Actinomadura sp. J1-007]
MVEVRTGRKDEARLLGEVLARAFADDPVIRWILPDGRGMTGMFVTLARHTHAAPGTAEIAYGENGPLGAALWDPPGYAASGWRTACAVVGFVRSMRGRVRYGQIVDDLLRKERPPEPHWYLAQIGATEPGKGVGSALLRSGLERCDRERMPAYLESSNEVNIPLYERFGFTVTGEIHIPDGPTCWPMWRPRRDS